MRACGVIGHDLTQFIHKNQIMYKKQQLITVIEEVMPWLENIYVVTFDGYVKKANYSINELGYDSRAA